MVGGADKRDAAAPENAGRWKLLKRVGIVLVVGSAIMLVLRLVEHLAS